MQMIRNPRPRPDNIERKTKTIYVIFGWETDEKPENWEVGSYWFLAIIGFPVWIWFWLMYKFLCFLGSTLNGVKTRTVTYNKREEKEKVYYDE